MLKDLLTRKRITLLEEDGRFLQRVVWVFFFGQTMLNIVVLWECFIFCLRKCAFVNSNHNKLPKNDYILLKEIMHLLLYLFWWKILCKNSFLYFLVFNSIKKKSKWKTIFGQHKKYDLFLEIVFHYFFFENYSILQQAK